MNERGLGQQKLHRVELAHHAREKNGPLRQHDAAHEHDGVAQQARGAGIAVPRKQQDDAAVRDEDAEQTPRREAIARNEDVREHDGVHCV